MQENYCETEEAQWPIGYGVGLRIKRSSVRIRPWPLRWVLGQGSLLPLSQGEAFTLASISYLAILVKYILAKKKKKLNFSYTTNYRRHHKLQSDKKSLHWGLFRLYFDWWQTPNYVMSMTNREKLLFTKIGRIWKFVAVQNLRSQTGRPADQRRFFWQRTCAVPFSVNPDLQVYVTVLPTVKSSPLRSPFTGRPGSEHVSPEKQIQKMGEEHCFCVFLKVCFPFCSFWNSYLSISTTS